MQFEIPVGAKGSGAAAARIRLEARLSKGTSKSERRNNASKPEGSNHSIPSEISSATKAAAESTDGGAHAAVTKAEGGSQVQHVIMAERQEHTGLVSSPHASQVAHHFNPNSTIIPGRIGSVPTRANSASARIASPQKRSSPAEDAGGSRALVIIQNRGESRAFKPPVPTRQLAAETHDCLRDRDFQTTHEELTHLRSNLPDLEKVISVLKTENVRLKTELLVKGKDCDHFKELSNQMKIARDREVSSLSRAREEWGKVVADRDHSINKLQKDLGEARQRLNENSAAVEIAEKERSRELREFSEDKAIANDTILQLRHALQQLEKESFARQSSHNDVVSSHSETTERMRNELHLLSVENNALRAKVVDWDAMVAEIGDLTGQIAEYKRNRNSTETRLRQELGEAAEEIHLLREEKSGLLRLVEKMELQANAAMCKLEQVSGRSSPSKGLVGLDTARPLSPEEEIATLTSTRTRITKELQSFRDGEWSNTLGSIGKLRQHLTEEEVKRREAEDRMEQERGARRRLEREIGDAVRKTEKDNGELRLMVSTRDKDIDELHRRQIESAHRYSQLKADAAKDRELLVAAQEEVSACYVQINDQKASYLSLSKENAKLFEQITAQAEIVQRLQDEVGGFGSERSSLQEEIASTEKERRRLQANFDEIVAEHAAMSDDLRSCRRVVSESKASVQQLEAKLLARGSHSESSADEKENADFTDCEEIFDENGNLLTPEQVRVYGGLTSSRIVRKRRVLPGEPEVEIEKMTRRQLRSELIKSRGTQSNFEKVIAELSAQLSSAEKATLKSKELEDVVASLSSEMARVTTLKVRAERESQIHSEQAAALSKKLADTESAHALCQSELVDVRVSLQNASLSLEALKISHASEVTRMADEHAVSKADFEGIISTLSADLSASKESLERATVVIDNTKIIVDGLTASIAEKLSALEASEAANCVLKEDADALTTSLAALSSKLQAFERLASDRQTAIVELQMAKDDVKLQFDAVSTERDALVDKVSSFLSKHDEMVTQHAEASSSAASILADRELALGALSARFKTMEDSLRNQLAVVAAELDSAKKDRAVERKNFAEQQDFDKKALMARIKQADAKRKELEASLDARNLQLRSESQRSSELTEQLKTQLTALKHKAQCDLEQMRESYERALAKLRSQVDGAEIIEDLRRKLAKAEKELRDIKQVQLHW